MNPRIDPRILLEWVALLARKDAEVYAERSSEALQSAACMIQKSLERAMTPEMREMLIEGYAQQLQIAGYRVTPAMLRLLVPAGNRNHEEE